MEIRIGNLMTNEGVEVVLTEKELATHALISGVTGSGKSMLLCLIALQMALQGQGFCMLDKDWKTAEDTMALIAEANIHPMLRRKIIYFSPSLECKLHIDPFWTKLSGVKHLAWLETRVELICKALARVVGLVDFKEQLRRARTLRHLLIFAGVKLNGRYLGLHRCFDLLDIGTQAWLRILRDRKGVLPPETFRYWTNLSRLSARDQWMYTESTWTLLEKCLTPVVLQIFTGDGKSQPIDFDAAVREGQILIFNLGATPEFSSEQGDAIGSFVLGAIQDACHNAAHS